MLKILLCCGAGMSTSILVKKMLQAAQERELEVEIKAVGMRSFEALSPDFDCYLLGPQIKYKFADFQAHAEKLGKPIAVIDPMDYGMMKGGKVLDTALHLLYS